MTNHDATNAIATAIVAHDDAEREAMRRLPIAARITAQRLSETTTRAVADATGGRINKDTVSTYASVGHLLALPHDDELASYGKSTNVPVGDDEMFAALARTVVNDAANTKGCGRRPVNSAVKNATDRLDAIRRIVRAIADAARPDAEETDAEETTEETLTDAARLQAIRAIVSGMTGDGTIPEGILATLRQV